MSIKILRLLLVVLLLAGCSASALSEEEAKSCILNATGFEEVGVEQKQTALGTQYGSVVINEIRIDNIVPKKENEYVVYTTVEIGQRQAGVDEETLEFAAKKLGRRFEDGFMVQEADLSYYFARGSKGWVCREMGS